MKNQVTFGHILTVLAIIIIPLILWGINVENRFEQVNFNTKEIQKGRIDFKEYQKENENNYDLILDKLHSIELMLKDKKDRE